jgi:hypothetical protein
MEKRSPLFYAGLFVVLFCAVLSFGIAALDISLFIRIESVSFLTKMVVSTLCAVGFVVSYFVFTLAFPIGKPYPANAEAINRSCSGAVVLIVWLMLFVALTILSISHNNSYSRLFKAAYDYNLAGMFFAQASNRINAMKKTNVFLLPLPLLLALRL